MLILRITGSGARGSGGFLLEASVSADYCLVSQKLFHPLQSPPTLDSLYPCTVLNFCKLLNNSKLRKPKRSIHTHSFILSTHCQFVGNSKLFCPATLDKTAQGKNELTFNPLFIICLYQNQLKFLLSFVPAFTLTREV